MQNFIDIIEQRGFVHQFTDKEGLRAYLADGKASEKRAYIGFDCTAKSLHVGSLLQIMLLRWWQKCGHTPIVLLGGGTTKIGDPSGKDEARQLLDHQTIAENMRSLKTVFARFIDFEDQRALMLDNDTWLSQLTMPFVFGVLGPLISINKMLAKDSIRQRLERQQHLSYLEFNYMILQAYDFVKLYEDYHCRVQLGGSDQWGNITAGIELHQKMQESQRVAKKEEIFGITSPLITTASGAKMGKTASGAVWLNADLLKPYDYWQFWRNTEDGDVIRFLKLFTELDLAQISEYETWVGSSRINDAKIILATEATALLHGREAASQAEATARETFAGSGVGSSLPEITLTKTALSEGVSLADMLVQAGFATSKSEARRLIKGGGVSVNDVKVPQEDHKLRSSDLNGDGFAKLSAGKKRHVLVKAG